MSLNYRRRCAGALARAVVSVVPPERRTWAEAMRVEVEHLPDSAAPSFAGGCLWAAIRARAASAAFVLQATRWTLAAGAMIWSALNLRLADRLSVADASLPASFAYVAAGLYGLGALATARLGLRATAVLITPVLALSAICAATATVLTPRSPHSAFYQALAVEEVGILLMALLIALGVSSWAARRRIAP